MKVRSWKSRSAIEKYMIIFTALLVIMLIFRWDQTTSNVEDSVENYFEFFKDSTTISDQSK